MARLLPVILSLLFLLSGCGGKKPTEESAGQPTGQEEAEVVKENTYQQITQEEANRMMDEQEDVIVLDVREQSEYDGGHIAGAVLLPVGSIDEESAAAVIPEKDSVVLVYCRSGNRSKTASTALAELGYTQVYEFGGVITWPFGLER